MTDEMNNDQMDANIEDSSAPQTEESLETRELQETSAEDSQGTEESGQVPFHEDPRIQDFVNRQVQKQVEALQSEFQSRYEELVQKIPEPSKPADKREALLQRLKGIDPDFGELIEEVYSQIRELPKLKEETAAERNQRIAEQYKSQVSSLHEQHEVPAEWRGLYEKQLKAEISANPKLTLQDVPNLYKQIHSELSKLTEGVRRQERASYVQDKSKDAKAPTSQTKGKVPARDDKGRFTFTDNEERLAYIAKKAAKRIRAESDF